MLTLIFKAFFFLFIKVPFSIAGLLLGLFATPFKLLALMFKVLGWGKYVALAWVCFHVLRSVALALEERGARVPAGALGGA